ncbi:MAG: methylmalonyl-CoA mutase small subunit [Bacteroidales bacterium]|nr:methylmalonyl-CoA mutase small subunit [Bacteroidales bacterium]
MMELKDAETLFDDFPPVTVAEWEEKIRKDLKGADYDKTLIWESPEGFPVKPYYTVDDLEGLEYLKSLPGEFPYIRGFRNGGNNWLIRQDIHSTDVDHANQTARDAILRGAQTIGFNVREITNHPQIRKLLSGVDLATVPVHFFGSRSYPLTAELFFYEIDRQGIEPSLIRGSFNFDPLSYLLTHGDFYVSYASNLEEAKYLLKNVQKKIPQFKVITVNGHLFQDAGSTLVQELAFALASGNEYLAGLTDKGFSPDDIASRIRFTFALGSNYFLEIAKLRAARLLWSKIVDQYQPEDPSSCRMDLHCVTARWNKTIFDPHVNMLRTTTEGMSGIFGNADSISIFPFDQAYKNPESFGNRIARNQQLILKEESYLDQVADPTAGAYFIESMTDSLANHAWNLFKEVEVKGGLVESIKQNIIQDAVFQSRRKKEKDFAQRKLLLLGTNQYPGLTEEMLNKITVEDPVIDEGPSSYKKMLPFRAAEPLEKLRLDTERYIASGNKIPTVFLLTMGKLAMLRARAGFATNFFGCAGYKIIDNPGFKSVESGVNAALRSSADMVVICSSDDEYKEIAPEITRKIKEDNSSAIVVVAGYPVDIIEELKHSGVDGFIHIKSNLLEELASYQQRLGVK